MPFPIIRSRQRSEQKSGMRYRHPVDGYSNVYLLDDRWLSLDYLYSVKDVINTPITQRVKPCSSWKFSYSGDHYQDVPLDHGYFVRWQDDVGPHIAFDVITEGAFPRFPHSDVVKANGKAFEFFAERFPTKISGAEFVQGLFELLALLPKFERSLTKTIAGGYLTKKFGWDNLLSDLKSFSSLLVSIRERMEFLKRTYGKPTKLLYHIPNCHTIDSWEYLYEPFRGVGTRLILESYRCDYHAGATLVQNLKHIDDFIGWLRAIVISLGLNNPLQSIWKTTRLSFVVDWFADVSGHLGRLAAIQPAEKWDVYDISSSITWTARFKVIQENTHLDGSPDFIRQLGVLVVKRYERVVGLPVDLTVFTPSTCTPDQLVLMEAMALAK
uniref:Uncharacterized protein n=1 Tax=Leviviridae sp. TaxID=2027243 RepID=A0A514DBR6_9VIRU|nr:MAG: hypothetical protein H2Rhizo33936_000001 [Leviviridae sp.]